MGLSRATALLAAIVLWPLCVGARADEFHQFAGIYGYGGYAQTPIGPNAKIRVYPRLFGYSREHPIVVKRDNTVNVPFFFDVSTPSLELVPEVVAKVLHQPYADISGYGVDVMAISDVTVVLEVNGDDIVADDLEGYITSPSGVVKGQLHYDGEETEVIEAIVSGDYILKANFTFPLSTFSGLSVNISGRSLSQYKAEAFRRVATQTRKQSGGFLFWKYSNEFVSQSVSRGLVESRTSSHARQTNIVMVDPTPELEDEVRRLLGFQDIQEDELIAAHNAAAAKAEGQSKRLAQLHRTYADAVLSGDLSKQSSALADVASLANPQILGFMSAGLAFQNGSSSRRQSFYSMVDVSTDSHYEEEFNQTIIRNASVRGVVRAGPFPKQADQMNSYLVHSAYPGLYTVPFGPRHEAASAVALEDTISQNDLNLFWRILVGYPKSITFLWEGKSPHPLLKLARSLKRKHMVSILEDKGLSGDGD